MEPDAAPHSVTVPVTKSQWRAARAPPALRTRSADAPKWTATPGGLPILPLPANHYCDNNKAW